MCVCVCVCVCVYLCVCMCACMCAGNTISETLCHLRPFFLFFFRAAVNSKMMYLQYGLVYPCNTVSELRIEVNNKTMYLHYSIV